MKKLTALILSVFLLAGIPCCLAEGGGAAYTDTDGEAYCFAQETPDGYGLYRIANDSETPVLLTDSNAAAPVINDFSSEALSGELGFANPFLFTSRPDFVCISVREGEVTTSTMQAAHAYSAFWRAEASRSCSAMRKPTACS
jgi:hypothetical protein